MNIDEDDRQPLNLIIIFISCVTQQEDRSRDQISNKSCGELEDEASWCGALQWSSSTLEPDLKPLRSPVRRLAAWQHLKEHK